MLAKVGRVAGLFFLNFQDFQDPREDLVLENISRSNGLRLVLAAAVLGGMPALANAHSRARQRPPQAWHQSPLW